MERQGRLERMHLLLNQLNQDIDAQQYKQMHNKYKRLSYHLSAIDAEVKTAQGVRGLSRGEAVALLHLKNRYAKLCQRLEDTQLELTVSNRTMKKCSQKIINGYYMKNLTRTSRHLNLVSK
ncbi:MAG: hypothetical protein JXO44_08825 [Clostridia bacterium]|nr:hypothetical protein [Clostridia bacterium]